jgi:cobalamin biosynthesis protein CobD/CbiB
MIDMTALAMEASMLVVGGCLIAIILGGIVQAWPRPVSIVQRLLGLFQLIVLHKYSKSTHPPGIIRFVVKISKIYVLQTTSNYLIKLA